MSGRRHCPACLSRPLLQPEASSVAKCALARSLLVLGDFKTPIVSNLENMGDNQ